MHMTTEQGALFWDKSQGRTLAGAVAIWLPPVSVGAEGSGVLLVRE